MLISISEKKVVYELDENNTIKERIKLILNYTVDHRYVDGAYAAKVSVETKKLLEEPSDELLLSD